ncbi:MAG: hypothetical protein ACJLUP_22110 [Agrobacterium tumefaciens]
MPCGKLPATDCGQEKGIFDVAEREVAITAKIEEDYLIANGHPCGFVAIDCMYWLEHKA